MSVNNERRQSIGIVLILATGLNDGTYCDGYVKLVTSFMVIKGLHLRYAFCALIRAARDKGQSASWEVNRRGRFYESAQATSTYRGYFD